MVPSLFICSECKEIEEDRTNVVTCAECGVGRECLLQYSQCYSLDGSGDTSSGCHCAVAACHNSLTSLSG